MAILSLIALTSCQKAFDVNSVHFSNDGGTKTITSSSYTLSIHDNNANYGTGTEDLENGVIHVEKDWLTAELDMKAGVLLLPIRMTPAKKEHFTFLECTAISKARFQLYRKSNYLACKSNFADR